jgi:hypothetical protein
VYLVIVFLLVILSMLLLSIKLERNLIASLKLTWYQSQAEESTFHWISKNVTVVVQENYGFLLKRNFSLKLIKEVCPSLASSLAA